MLKNKIISNWNYQTISQTRASFSLKKQNYSKVEYKGFTLIELLVVIAIIAILVTLVVFVINPVQVIGKSQDTRRRSDLQAMRQSLQLFFSDYKYYPGNNSSGQMACYSTTAGHFNFRTFNGTDQWQTNGTSGCPSASSDTYYIRAIPRDPVNNTGFGYVYQAYNCTSNICQSYRLIAAVAYPNGDDNNSVTKCGAYNAASDVGVAAAISTFPTGGSGATTWVNRAKFEVCND